MVCPVMNMTSACYAQVLDAASFDELARVWIPYNLVRKPTSRHRIFIDCCMPRLPHRQRRLYSIQTSVHGLSARQPNLCGAEVLWSQTGIPNYDVVNVLGMQTYSFHGRFAPNTKR